jgi:anti-anti-sigma factor
MSGCWGRPSGLPGFQAVVTDDGSAYVAITGDLDVTVTAFLAERLAGLAEASPARLVIDMSAVSFLDCAAARLLAGAAVLLPPGRRPVLTACSPEVRRLLQLTDLAGSFELAD